jgi:hypothetical protein
VPFVHSKSGYGVAVLLVRSPCLLHRAVQPEGVTCTTMRRAQSGQNRGGSSARRSAQRGCSPSATGFPHWSQNTRSSR